ncbi:hypothetical protein NPIL_12831, partial [Nephila pilipes]
MQLLQQQSHPSHQCCGTHDTTLPLPPIFSKTFWILQKAKFEFTFETSRIDVLMQCPQATVHNR